VDTFLSSAGDQRKQIISLGAGSDTRYFRLMQKRRKLDLVYHELDFDTNTRKKIRQMRSQQFSTMAKNLADVDLHAEDVAVLDGEASLTSPGYTVHAQDLRQLSHTDNPLAAVDPTLPTLIISECCLVYLAPEDADAVLQHFANRFPTATPLAIVIYEPIRPHDPFGRTMISNLASRGLQLQTLEKYHDLSQQRERLRRYDFGADNLEPCRGAAAADIDFIWSRWISAEEKERVESLEWMDEVEEFVLLAKHYCISLGWRGFPADSTWTEIPWPTT
jgi:[phosphatase 2A protein]-leucine-carboxy methyltransferase